VLLCLFAARRLTAGRVSGVFSARLMVRGLGLLGRLSWQH
jgi:hypothetical protein